jgi:hypothetical protein
MRFRHGCQTRVAQIFVAFCSFMLKYYYVFVVTYIAASAFGCHSACPEHFVGMKTGRSAKIMRGGRSSGHCADLVNNSHRLG